MSKYTTEVRYICEEASGLKESKGYKDIDEIISGSIPSIFSFPLDIFDESYKNVLYSKILKHYYTREIGFETVGLWKLKLETKLQEIMPFYNQLYKSELLKFNPLYDTDMQTTHVGGKESENVKQENKTGVFAESDNKSENGNYGKSTDNLEGENNKTENKVVNKGTSVVNDKTERSGSNNEEGSSTNTGSENANSKETDSKTHYDLYSDTPQGALTGVDEEEYLTNARKITDIDNKNGNNNKTSLEHAQNKNEGEFSENSKTSSTNVNNNTSEQNYETKNSKTSIGNETGHNTVTGNSSKNGNAFENTNGTDKFNSTESYILHVVGKQSGASYSKLLREFRETFLNIDMNIIEELSDLFMKLW